MFYPGNNGNTIMIPEGNILLFYNVINKNVKLIYS